MLTEADNEIEQMLEYWRGICGAQLMLAKSAFNPMDVPAALPHISIHERMSPTSYIYRIHGTALVSTASGDNTGDDIINAMPEIWRRPLFDIMNTILDLPCGIREEHILRDPIKGLIHRDGLHLPLANDDGAATFMLSYYPPLHPGDDLALSLSREPNSIREPIGFADLAYIDIGAGIPEFAGQIVAKAREISDNLLKNGTS